MNKNKKNSSVESNENIHKKEDGPYYVVSKLAHERVAGMPARKTACMQNHNHCSVTFLVHF